MDFSNLFSWANLQATGLFLLKPILIFLICKVAIKIITKVSGNILNKSKVEVGIQGYIKSALKIALWVLTIIFVADSVGINTASLVAVLSVVSLALSLSVQNIMTNAFSGITLLISKPFKVGDFITVAGVSGTVKSINLMRTTLSTADNKKELIPNGDICASTITNYSSATSRRVELKFSASYDAETETVKKAIFDVIDNDKEVSEKIIREEGKMPFVRLSAYNANDIEYTVRVWTSNADYWQVHFDINEKVRESFKKYGVEFSYPHTIVHIEKDE